MPIKNSIEKFYKYIKSLNLDLNQHSEEFEYKNAALILVDAVLSMNRKYDSFVVPRIKLVKKAGIKTLGDLKDKIDSEKVTGFCDVWQYNHVARVKILRSLVKKFLQIKKNSGIIDDLKALHFWGKNSRIDDFKTFNVKGIGFTTFQYLRLMCGADTTKPDVHLKRAVKDGIGKSVSEIETVRIVETVAKQLGVSARQLDYAIWKYYSKRSDRPAQQIL